MNTVTKHKYELPLGKSLQHLRDQGFISPTAELVPFTPAPASPDQVVGRQVSDVCTIMGTYGMGGAGFFGLQLGNEWLVVAVWGAACWIVANGRLVADGRHDEHGRPKPWEDDIDEFKTLIVGQTITSFHTDRISMTIQLSNGLKLEITESANTRPVYDGLFKIGAPAARVFSDDDDLKSAVFLSPKSEIWI
jgi:hypothetical protein